MMTSSNGSIFRVTGQLCGELTGHRWIPRTKCSETELWCFLWSTVWINGWVNNREAGDLWHHRAYYDVTVMSWPMKVRWTFGVLSDWHVLWFNNCHTVSKSCYKNCVIWISTKLSHCSERKIYVDLPVTPFLESETLAYFVSFQKTTSQYKFHFSVMLMLIKW